MRQADLQELIMHSVVYWLEKLRSDTDTKVTAVESNGSADNVDQVDAGDADIAFCQSDVMAYAHDGINLFEGDPIDSFSTVAALYQEQVQIITTNPAISRPLQI